MIKIKIYAEDCEFCKYCAEELPDVFKMGNFAVELKKESVKDECLESLRNIIKNCPGDAIELVE